jgi:hypothetical protein
MVDGYWGRTVQGIHCVGGDGGKRPDGRIDCIDVMVEAYCRFGMGILNGGSISFLLCAGEKLQRRNHSRSQVHSTCLCCAGVSNLTCSRAV